MRQLRNVLFWAHLITGVCVAAVVLIMSVTGVLLTYQRQVTAWADTRGLQGGPPSPEAERLGAEALLARVQPDGTARPTSLRWHSDPERTVEVAFGRERTVFVNAYTGEALGEGNSAVRGFFRTVVSWHRWLGQEGESRDLGRSITGASNLGFLFLVLSGLYLWWPRNWAPQALRNVTLFRRGLSGKARDFNWHNVVGFWSALPLALVVASAVMISYPWGTALVYRLAGDTPPPPAAGPSGPARGGADEAPFAGAGLDGMLARAQAQVPGWRSITLPLSDAPDEPLVFAIDRGDGGQPHLRASLSLDRATGAVVKWETFADSSPGRRLRSILRFAHTGEVVGMAGQTLAGLVSAGGALLVWTGLALAWRRFRTWRGRGSNPSGLGVEPRSTPRRKVARSA